MQIRHMFIALLASTASSTALDKRQAPGDVYSSQAEGLIQSILGPILPEFISALPSILSSAGIATTDIASYLNGIATQTSLPDLATAFPPQFQGPISSLESALMMLQSSAAAAGVQFTSGPANPSISSDINSAISSDSLSSSGAIMTSTGPDSTSSNTSSSSSSSSSSSATSATSSSSALSSSSSKPLSTSTASGASTASSSWAMPTGLAPGAIGILAIAGAVIAL